MTLQVRQKQRQGRMPTICAIADMSMERMPAPSVPNMSKKGMAAPSVTQIIRKGAQMSAITTINRATEE
jgi:hypothetical protein